MIAIEAIYPGQRWVSTGDNLVIEATDDQILYQRERLLNIGLEKLRDDPPFAVCWPDADIEWTEPERVIPELRKAMETHDAVHLFERAEMLGQDGRIIETRRSYLTGPQNPGEPRPATGLCWAARWSLIGGGFFDASIHPSADVYTLAGWGLREMRPVSAGVRKAWEAWKPIQPPSVGFLPLTVRHHWHGGNGSRRYTHRAQAFRKAQFDPVRDMRLADNGLWEWTGTQPDLQAAEREILCGSEVRT